MRRQFGPRGGVARQDVPVAPDADLPSDNGEYNAARAAYRKAKKQSGRKIREENGSRVGNDRVKGGGRALNWLNRRTGVGVGAISVIAITISRRIARYADYPEMSLL